MRYFIDTEFIESGPHQPIELISIGMVDENGREYYAVSSEFDPDDASEWVQDNVLPHIAAYPQKTLAEIAADILQFVGAEIPEFWGYYADYDWVVFCQIFGTMMNLPKGWPMFCRDIKQRCDELGNPALPPQGSTEHNALNDAKWNAVALAFLETAVPPAAPSCSENDAVEAARNTEKEG